MSQISLTVSELPGLPAELLLEIFKIAAWNHRPTALILARITRGFSKDMLRIVYDVVSLHPRPGEGYQTRADLFRVTIETYPERALWTKVLLHLPSEQNGNLDIISHCSRVRKLYLTRDALFQGFNPTYDDGADLEINMGNALSMRDSLQAQLFRIVTHLIFQQNIPDYTLVSRILLLPRLTHLSMGFAQCPRNKIPQQALLVNMQNLLARRDLKLVHLYFGADLLKTYVDPYFVDMARDLIILSDTRLFVGFGRRWGDWQAWYDFYRKDRDFWQEIITECATWRRDVLDPRWVYGRCAQPAYI